LATDFHSILGVGEGNISLSCSMQLGLVMLDRQKHKQPNH